MVRSWKLCAVGYYCLMIVFSLINCQIFNDTQVNIHTSPINVTGQAFNNDATTKLKPKVNFEVSRHKGIDIITAIVNWQRAPYEWDVSSYKLSIKTTGSSRCLKNFQNIETQLNKYEVDYSIPPQDPPHDFKYRCNYSLELTAFSKKHNISYIAKTNVYISDCIGNMCECQISAVQNLTATIQRLNVSANTTAVVIHWNYPILLNRNKTQIEHFIVYLRYLRYRDGVHQKVPYYNNVTDYSTNFTITNKNPLIITVIAVSNDGCLSVAKEPIIQNASTPVRDPGETSTNSSGSPTYTGIVLLSGALVVTAIASVAFLLKKRLLRNQQRILTSIDNLQLSRPTKKMNINPLYVDRYEISHDSLDIEKEIGKGAFGKVFSATAEGITGISKRITVAVKYLKDSPNEQEKEEFLGEIELMKRAGHHHNVIHMLACCTIQEPFCMVMEYIEYGDLLNYLKILRSEYKQLQYSSCSTALLANTDLSNCNRSFALSIRDLNKENSTGNSSIPQTNGSESSEVTIETNLYNGSSDSYYKRDSILDSKQLINFAMQISSGMIHLGEKGIVHRDLAARNILIGVGKVLKISDFGLSRTGVYVTRRGGKVPLRWLSIEAIRDRTYSSQSDVWAFGIVLFEICTLGGVPYATVADRDLYTYLIRGKRLERPPLCSEKLYDVMTMCWNEDPKARPTFHQLLNILSDMELQAHDYVNFSNVEGLELHPTDETT